MLAAPDANLDIIAYEMTLLVERAGRMITPPTRQAAVAANARGPGGDQFTALAPRLPRVSR